MSVEQDLINLYESTVNEQVESIEPLPRSASYRRYYRIIGRTKTLIGTYNPNTEENIAFLYMSEFFSKQGLNVPQIYAKDIEKNIYLQQDLGDQTLLTYIHEHPHSKLILVRQALDNLIRFQTIDIDRFDWTKCYPAPCYDRQVYMIDLQYFKYMVLRLLKVQYNDLKLEREFDKLLDIVLSVNHSFFVYRDFQSRNIMYHGGSMYFVDYQGSRQGSLFYDLASLLYDTKLSLTNDERKELTLYYFERTRTLHGLNRKEFLDYLAVFALIRKLQALAAYCFRGLVEKKIIFITGLEKAFDQIMDLFDNDYLRKKFPLLIAYLSQARENIPYRRLKVDVRIEINSFSFIYAGYPPNDKENGGGFVFDCRMLPNPGHLEQFMNKTGLDEEVGRWLEAQPEFEDFIVSAFGLIYSIIVGYQKKGYTDLQVNFGCTGGRHRSVYCAEKMAWLLRQFFDTEIIVRHRQAGKWRLF